MKLMIFGGGSFVGEDDVIFRDSYSCTLKCISQKGVLFEVLRSPEEFVMWIRAQDETWLNLMYQTVKKDSRRRADWIRPIPKKKL